MTATVERAKARPNHADHRLRNACQGDSISDARSHRGRQMRHPEKIRRKGRAGKSYDVWQVRFTDAHGLIRYRSFRTKSDAQGFSAEAETAKRGGASASADVRFDTLCTEYRESHLPSLRESSREQVEADLARLESHFGRRTLRSLTPATIEDFRRDELLRIRDRQSALHARRVARTERAIAALKADESEQRERLQATLAYLSERGARVPMSGIRTVNKALGALRTLLKFAQSRGYVLGNSASHVRKIKSAPHIDRPMDQQILTPSELQRLIGATDPNWRAAIGVLAYGGLRIGELLALQWGDVELDAARVLVQRQVDTGTGEIRDPKTKAGRRFVELPAFVVRDLRIWKAACPPQAEGQADWCFPNAVGGSDGSIQFSQPRGSCRRCDERSCAACASTICATAAPRCWSRAARTLPRSADTWAMRTSRLRSASTHTGLRADRTPGSVRGSARSSRRRLVAFWLRRMLARRATRRMCLN